MNGIADSLSSRDVADVVAYFAKLPAFADPQDNRIFPQSRPDPVHMRQSHRVWFLSEMENVAFRRARLATVQSAIVPELPRWRTRTPNTF